MGSTGDSTADAVHAPLSHVPSDDTAGVGVIDAATTGVDTGAAAATLRRGREGFSRRRPDSIASVAAPSPNVPPIAQASMPSTGTM